MKIRAITIVLLGHMSVNSAAVADVGDVFSDSQKYVEQEGTAYSGAVIPCEEFSIGKLLTYYCESEPYEFLDEPGKWQTRQDKCLFNFARRSQQSYEVLGQSCATNEFSQDKINMRMENTSEK